MNGRLLVALLAVALAVGCVPTLHPVYTERDLTFDPAIVGFWRQKDAAATWKFDKAGKNEYALTYTDQEGRTGAFEARLAEIGGLRFLDLFPVKEDIRSSEFYKFHLMPIHTVYIVRQTGPTVQLAGFDLKWLDQFLAENPDALPHSAYNGQRLITATTEQLQGFLLEHQDRFTVEFSLVSEQD